MTKYTDHDILFSSLDDIDDINICKDFIVELRRQRHLLTIANNENTDNVARTVILSTSLIHKVFEYIDDDYKLLIHREGSTDEQRSKKLSIELIMRSGLEEYFEDVLLSRRLKGKLCTELSLIHI